MGRKRPDLAAVEESNLGDSTRGTPGEPPRQILQPLGPRSHNTDLVIMTYRTDRGPV